MTTDPLWASPSSSPLALPRVQLHSGAPLRRSLLKLAVASVPGVLQNPDGTGRVYVRVDRLRRRTGTR